MNRKVPFVKARQTTECDLCCVTMILKVYKSYETMEDFKESYSDFVLYSVPKEEFVPKKKHTNVWKVLNDTVS